jgi:phage terminase small subunit
MPRGGARPGAGRKAKVPASAERKEKGPGRGGKRENAGRRITVERVDKLVRTAKAPDFMVDIMLKASQAGITPAEYMMAVMNDPNADWDRRDRMAIAAAPYLHARLQGVSFHMAPPPSSMPGRYATIEPDAESDVGALEVARRVAFTLALGHQKAKKS